MTNNSNPELELAREFISKTNQNIFLTGKAGTGKTTFLLNLRKSSPKRMIVVAPTGVAAINAAGVTIHSFFQISFGPQVPGMERTSNLGADPQTGDGQKAIRRMSREKISIIRSLDLLVIDEISMVRADLLDAIDEVLRKYRNRNKPFGGVQLLMIGDLQQLAPVVKGNEWEILGKYYATPYFFSSRALRDSAFFTIELKKVYRQSNENFIRILNKIRDNAADEDTLRELNQRYRPGFRPDDSEGYVTLTTHNHQAAAINDKRLSELPGKEHSYEAEVKGDFPESSFPTGMNLVLKVDAQVMFVKNDSSIDKRYYNGKIGRVVALEEDYIEVLCQGDKEPVQVSMEDWENVRYTVNPGNKEIQEEVIGTFRQYPLKLAWAITIHKSQGLTFDKVIVDARDSFAHGQVYVALSRCRSLEGLVLSSPLAGFSIKKDHKVNDFTRNVEENPAGITELGRAKVLFQQQLLAELFDFRPALRFLDRLSNKWEEHKEYLTGNLNEVIPGVQTALVNELMPVSGKFTGQLAQLTSLDADPEQNVQLQERLKKASEWYLQRLKKDVQDAFAGASFECDNREIRKEIHEIIEKLSVWVTVTTACLKQLSREFEISSFLAVKARATLEPVSLTGRKQGGVTQTATSSPHPALYSKLREWRKMKAEEEGVEPYRILSQKVVLQIIQDLPSNRDSLSHVSGIGKVKIKKYGKEILHLVVSYLIENGINYSDVPEKQKESRKKGDSPRISLDMFKEGKSIQKIAGERGLAVSTIESHLASFVARGELGLDGLVERNKADRIARFFSQNRGASLKDAREALGESFTYGELKMVCAFLELHGNL